MAKGICLAIGLNSVNPKHYDGWEGELAGCENDANDIADLARTANFDVKILLTKEATVDNVINSLSNSSIRLEKGDIFLLSYSGHGGQVRDFNKDEDDYLDETWCLYDRQFLDDELYFYICKFVEGVRISVFSDCCHSGTVVRGGIGIDKFKSNVDKKGNRYKFAPDRVLLRTYEQNKALYDNIQSNPELNNTKYKVSAPTLMISGCTSDELSQDGIYNGYFTSSLKRVWDNGKFDGSYKKFHKLLYNMMMTSDQHPQYITTGKEDKNFHNQKPFTI